MTLTLPVNHSRAAGIVADAVAAIAASAEPSRTLFQQQLALDAIVESPKNPRRHYDPTRLQELVDSIAQRGLLEPVVVRPAWRGEREVFELGAGHRRTRAARIAGLTHVPAIIRAMDDVEFLEMLTISNLQREDVSPIEEAEGYQVLLADGGYDVAALALKLGKSESYVYGRLKLLELHVAVREALARDYLSLAHATELGKVDHAAQLEALRVLWNLDPKKLEAAATALEDEAVGPSAAPADPDDDDDDFDDGDLYDEETAEVGGAPARSATLQAAAKAERAFTVKSWVGITRVNVAELREHLVANVYVELKRAPFPLQDATLVPAAGACVTCPKRSGITQSLFPELEGNDVCLDRACFHTKVSAQLERTMADERTRHPGVDVVKLSHDSYGKVPRGVLKAGMYKPQGPAASEPPTKKARIGVYIDGPARGTAVWIKVADELVEKAVAGKAVTAPSTSSGGPANYAEQQRKAEATRAKAQAGLTAAVDAVLQNIRSSARSLEEWLRLLSSLLVVVTTDPRDLVRILGRKATREESLEELLIAQIRTAPPEELIVTAVRLALGDETELGWRAQLPESIRFLGDQLTVDVVSIAKLAEQAHAAEVKAKEKADAAAKPTPKKATPKKAAKKGAKKIATFMQLLQPSAALAVIVGDAPLARTEVVKKIWDYIKANGLQDKKNKRMLNADDALRPVFGGKDQVSMFNMTKLVSAHLTPAPVEPITTKTLVDKSTKKSTKSTKAVA